MLIEIVLIDSRYTFMRVLNIHFLNTLKTTLNLSVDIMFVKNIIYNYTYFTQYALS